MAQTIDVVAPARSAKEPLFDRRMIAGLAILVGILTIFLTYTRLPSAISKFSIVDIAATKDTQSAFSQILDPAAFPGALEWIAYGVNLWDANAIGMFFAMLLGGAAMTAFQFSPRTRVRNLLGKGGVAGAGLGGALGVPLFMCSACSAPVSLGFYRGGAALETSLGVILGSALFHPISLMAIFLLMPVEMAAARIAFGLVMLLAVVPAVARLRTGSPACAVGAPPGLEAPPSGGPAGERIGWVRAGRQAVSAWADNTVDFALKLGPPMLLAGFVVGVIFSILPPQGISGSIGTGAVAILIAAAVGTLVQVPGMFEIPLTLGVLALGLGEGAATAILLTVPSTGLITFGVTRREYGWKVPGSMMAATFALGSAAGFLVRAL